uniref:Secreted protein n=1 Tax=Strongyloides stercoralis TaxID=6248 RepID=A0A0K0E6F2_STRER
MYLLTTLTIIFTVTFFSLGYKVHCPTYLGKGCTVYMTPSEGVWDYFLNQLDQDILSLGFEIERDDDANDYAMVNKRIKDNVSAEKLRAFANLLGTIPQNEAVNIKVVRNTDNEPGDEYHFSRSSY